MTHPWRPPRARAAGVRARPTDQVGAGTSWGLPIPGPGQPADRDSRSDSAQSGGTGSDVVAEDRDVVVAEDRDVAGQPLTAVRPGDRGQAEYTSGFKVAM